MKFPKYFIKDSWPIRGFCCLCGDDCQEQNQRPEDRDRERWEKRRFPRNLRCIGCGCWQDVTEARGFPPLNRDVLSNGEIIVRNKDISLQDDQRARWQMEDDAYALSALRFGEAIDDALSLMIPKDGG